MAMTRVLTAVLVVAMAVAASPSAALARCIGPQVRHDRATVDRDGTVHVVGTQWGDNCYDVGDPPAGEEVLGRPVIGIEIYLVQDGVQHLVASGDADETYAFEVDVPVPDGLKPGPAEVVARLPDGLNSYDVPAGSLVITDVPATGSSDDAPVRFGDAGQGAGTTTTTTAPASPTEPPARSEGSTASSDTSSSDTGDGGGISPVVVGGAVLAAVALAIGAVLLSRLRTKT